MTDWKYPPQVDIEELEKEHKICMDILDSYAEDYGEVDSADEFDIAILAGEPEKDFLNEIRKGKELKKVEQNVKNNEVEDDDFAKQLKERINKIKLQC